MTQLKSHHTLTIISCAWVCLFTVMCSSGLSQSILHQGNEWIYEHNIYTPGVGIESQTIEKISIGTDTVINNHTYTRLIASKEPPCRIYRTIEFVREDGNRLFRLGPDGQSEYKMIDFTDSVGYEMHFWSLVDPGSIDTAFTIIDSFGSEYVYDGTIVGVQYMRIFNNQSYDNDAVYKVYQNVGFVQYGLLFPDLGTGLCDVFEGTRLRCHVTSKDTIHFTEFDCFESSIPDTTENLGWVKIELFPNPSYGEVYAPDELEVKGIYNIDGISQMFSQTGRTLSIDNLVPSVYIVILISRNKSAVFYGKIVKM